MAGHRDPARPGGPAGVRVPAARHRRAERARRAGRRLGHRLDRADNFIAFLADLVAATPAGLEPHCIVDNLSAHGTQAVAEFLDQPEHHHVFPHRTPIHASWLNQVELLFSILQRRLIRYGEFTSVDDLAAKVITFINDYDKRARPFRWTYDGRPLQAA